MCSSVKRLFIGFVMAFVFLSYSFSSQPALDLFSQAEQELSSIESNMLKSNELLEAQQAELKRLQDLTTTQSSQLRELSRSLQKSERSRKLWKGSSVIAALTAVALGVTLGITIGVSR